MPNKSKVNLYLPSMRPIKEKLPLSLMIKLWFATGIILAALASWQHFIYVDVALALEQSNRELEVSKVELAALQTRHADFKPSPLLLTKLDRLTQELNGKRFLSQHLKGDEGPVTHDYSEVMLDMARYHDERLWVTKMRFDGQGVFLKGYTTDAMAVPKWLNQLQKSPFFSGKSFALMNLKHDKQQALVFEINTIAKQDMAEDEKLAAIQALTEAAK